MAAATQPLGTYDMLHTLIPQQSAVFPVSSTSILIRPDQGDSTSPEESTAIEQRVTFIRNVLGGWLSSLQREEGKNGAHRAESVTEPISILLASVDGPLQYLVAKPRALLFKPATRLGGGQSVGTSAAGGAGGGGGAGLGLAAPAPAGDHQDLVTFLLPAVLRATASLQAALLSTSIPSVRSGRETEKDKLWKSREKLKEKLEELVATCVRILADGAVRVDWKSSGGKESVQGGLGKAREVVQELIRLVEGLILSGNSDAPLQYPQTMTLFESSSSSRAATTSTTKPSSDIFNLSLSQSSTIIPLKSSLHARSLLLSTTSILNTIVTQSPFLSDFYPKTLSCFLKSWPALTPFHSNSTIVTNKEKGKQRASLLLSRSQKLIQERILATTLTQASNFLSACPLEGFSTHSVEGISLRVLEEFKNLLVNDEEFVDEEEMDVDGEEEDRGEERKRVLGLLVKLVEMFWKELKDVNGEGKEGWEKLAHAFSMVTMECGERMVDCITSEEDSAELKICSTFLLSSPLLPLPSPSGLTPNLLRKSPTSLSLIPPNYLHALSTFIPLRPALPFDPDASTSKEISESLLESAKTAWKELGTELRSNSSTLTPRKAIGGAGERKRRRDEGRVDSDGVEPEVEKGGEGGKRKKGGWMEDVGMVLKLMKRSEELGDAGAGVEGLFERIFKSLLDSNPTDDVLVSTFKTLGLLSCARSSTLTFPSSTTSYNDSFPSCTHCDHWSSLSSQSSLPPPTPTSRPIRLSPLLTSASSSFKKSLKKFLNTSRTEVVRLGFLKCLTRVLEHSDENFVGALDWSRKGELIQGVLEEMGAATNRGGRLAAGNVLVEIVEAYQTKDPDSIGFIPALMTGLDTCLSDNRAAVIETTLITVGRLARLAVPQGLLECKCLERFVVRLGHPNTFLKSAARTQLEQVATYREIKPYALIQPHFPVIAPLLVQSRLTSTLLTAALDCFHQPRDTFLRFTREFTLPSLILNQDSVLLNDIAEASHLSVPQMLAESASASAIFKELYMREMVERKKGLAFFMKEFRRALGGQAGGTKNLSLAQMLESVKVPLIYKLALELGDEDIKTQRLAETALMDVDRTCRQVEANAKTEIGSILKESIVGILSFMNRGLNEAASHRPLRDKQRILRTLQAVTMRFGPGIAGFSPQIMATLQSALEIKGLRSVTLNALNTFITTLKFGEIGPYIGTTSATFIRLWPQFSAAERKTATETLEYIVLQNMDGLETFVHDIADLSGIQELSKVNDRLQALHKNWSFTQRSGVLLVRIGSENDVVALQALQELKTLMAQKGDQLQALSAGDSFDKSLGPLMKTLMGAAVKDGPENEQLRNVAFECIGILGALDPDRFEIPPADPPMIVMENFRSHEESIDFALHLIQDLLIGAYRTTNDTKHQEFLAYAIQELLSFCGFTPNLINPGNKPVDAAIRKRWNSLPKSVLETCGPLLGGSFQFKERTSPTTANYPIYSSTTSYRDWIRIWANDLISKLKGDAVKRIFGAFPPVLHLEDITVAQYLLPHLVLNALISGDQTERQLVRAEIETILTDQISPTHQLSENSRLLSAQTVFDLMDHVSQWITGARKQNLEAEAQKRKGSKSHIADPTFWKNTLLELELTLTAIPQILLGEAALTCKAYARSLLNFESHIVAQRKNHGDDAKLQAYYENLHECYAALDEPDGMEGITTKIVSPSILHQIREHESTGRWTSAQSCWEVKLQQTPDDPANHLGLLRCLRNLGHYDSMRTHIVGIVHSRNEHADWDRLLAPFNIAASLIVGDWDAVEETLCIPDIEGPEVTFGRVISAMRHDDAELLARACFEGREQLGSPIVAAGRESYRRVYDSVVHLNILQELADIHRTKLEPPKLLQSLRKRLDATSPSFRAREPILNMRRTAFRLRSTDAAKREIAELWLETSKIARKAGHSQTAYSAILQARDLCDANDPRAPFVFLQNAKLLKAGDQQYKAIQCIDNGLQSLLPARFLDAANEKSPAVQSLITHGPPSVLAKAALRRARWMHEAGRLEPDDILVKYYEPSRLSPDWETPYYYLGHYHDQIADAARDRAKERAPGSSRKSDTRGDEYISRQETVKLFSKALKQGTKFIYQAMPRMLTIWLEAGEEPEVVEFVKQRRKDKTFAIPKRSYEQISAFMSINSIMGKNSRRLAPYQWLTVLPQLVSRILHPNDDLVANLDAILVQVLVNFPHQGFWAMASGVKSQTGKRSRRSTKILGKATTFSAETPSSVSIGNLFEKGSQLVDELLKLCNFEIKTKLDTLSFKTTFPDLWRLAPISLIIPLQSSLTVALPSEASHMATHKPFPDGLVTFKSFEDTILIMSSLQRPRKISIRGDDGGVYSFLCKPKDDLRKDARLMEFNSMIIKLLKKDSDARNRRLTIRTYSVVPLNEECGLIEWVPNVVVLRSILNKLYASHNVPPWSPELKKLFESIRDPPERTAEKFDTGVLTKFKPVFHEWFLEAFPEPSAWLRARLAYSRTAAVMSMVGFVLGLGDRHCENILIDGTTGDTVHVDFNCLFDRGRTFDVAEQVPFRLTTNIIAGMGVTGVEGVFRRAAEISLRILRHNKDSLMSVLETFLHDPLVEWSTKKPRDSPGELALFIRKKARENLDPIANKLRGLQVTSNPDSKGETEVDVGEQVERLIREARSSKNLGSMYVGWAAWF